MFSPIQAILAALGVSVSQSAGYVVAHVTTLQKPFISLRQYAVGLFGALLSFSFSSALAGYVLSTALLSFDFTVIASVIAAMIFPQFLLHRVIRFAKIEKTETIRKLQQKKPRPDRRRYFYT